MQPIIADEATGLFYRKWVAPNSKAAVLLVHGLGAHTGRWEFLAEYFLKQGISCYALELDGFGETKTLKGHVNSFGVYINDIRRLRDIIASDLGNAPVFLLGESMGALVALIVAGRKGNSYSGTILINPAFKSKFNFTALQYIKVFAAMLYNPKKQFRLPFNLMMCTRDETYAKAEERDPREHRFASARMLMNILISRLQIKLTKKNISSPLLFLVAGDDDIVFKKNAYIFYDTLKNHDKKIIEYPGMRHALSIEMGKEKVFGDMLKWMESKICPTSSR